jgi:hypothetical protein
MWNNILLPASECSTGDKARNVTTELSLKQYNFAVTLRQTVCSDRKIIRFLTFLIS